MGLMPGTAEHPEPCGVGRVSVAHLPPAHRGALAWNLPPSWLRISSVTLKASRAPLRGHQVSMAGDLGVLSSGVQLRIRVVGVFGVFSKGRLVESEASVRGLPECPHHVAERR